MASSDTKERLSSGGFLGILNVLMQLRKASSTALHMSYGRACCWTSCTGICMPAHLCRRGFQ